MVCITCEQSKCDSCSDSLYIDPEGHPGQEDNQDRGQVDLEQVVFKLPLQVQFHEDAWKVPYKGKSSEV